MWLASVDRPPLLPNRYAACRRRMVAASGHIASNAAWPNFGASVGYPARNHATTLFSIPFISVLLCEVCLHLRTDVEKAPGTCCSTRNYGLALIVARLRAQAAYQAIFSFCALCSARRSARIRDASY